MAGVHKSSVAINNNTSSANVATNTLWVSVPILENFPELLSAAFEDKPPRGPVGAGGPRGLLDGSSGDDPSDILDRPHIFAHVYMVRSGTGSLAEHLARLAEEEAESNRDSNGKGKTALMHGPEDGLLSADVLHASNRITEYMEETVIRKRRNLLGNADVAKNETNHKAKESSEKYSRDNSELARAIRQQKQSESELASRPVIFRLPAVWPLTKMFLRTEKDSKTVDVPLYTGEALHWVGSIFAIGGLVSPSPVLGGIRVVLGSVVLPILVKLHLDMMHEVDMERRRKLQEKAEQRGLTKMSDTDGSAVVSSLLGTKPAILRPHLVPKLTIALGIDSESYDARAPPPLMFFEIQKDKRTQQPKEKLMRYPIWNDGPGKGRGIRYAPGFSLEHFGTLSRQYLPIHRALAGEATGIDDESIEMQSGTGSSNSSSPTSANRGSSNHTTNSDRNPSILIALDVTRMMRFTIHKQLEVCVAYYRKTWGLSRSDLEELQEWLFRHPLHILILMQVIGFLQVFFTTMAFKNDIGYFKGRQDYRGLSSRSLATDCLQSLIVFLYLADFDNISRIVLFQVGGSALIGMWKYWKVAKLGLSWEYRVPWLVSKRKRLEEEYQRKLLEEMVSRRNNPALGNVAGAVSGGATESSTQMIVPYQVARHARMESITDDIDKQGMFYLQCILYPLSAFWGLYNLYHYAYKSWWSWLISSLADFAYTFGFINMTPQLFVNYKLKTVSFMPWRVLIYKMFQTFVDDIFAFCLMSDQMTAKHRWMTLRDDLVFFILIFQWFIYKEDRTRADEYGYVYHFDDYEKENGGERKQEEHRTDIGAEGSETARPSNNDGDSEENGRERKEGENRSDIGTKGFASARSSKDDGDSKDASHVTVASEKKSDRISFPEGTEEGRPRRRCVRNIGGETVVAEDGRDDDRDTD
eukprot:gnl/MRDRNA2_/MRDRNA2_34968_c0_seq1.p1 gnl/MRDRNA2_/MRDRNA2_34968_c0~~gnl/MRDRNA2_/MRDRNA2_34968_c0_seq1.p1  ORF type:complete len:986 (+),score=89.21 gnl/MRDRNA2_/MRDRNA2_34968_c0_seq1:188-2959(+)